MMLHLLQRKKHKALWVKTRNTWIKFALSGNLCPMKNSQFIPVILLLLASFSLYAIDIKDVEMSGYARAGSGTNTFGGDQECFYNQGSGGGSGIGRNEFRLGNECSNYLEIAFKFNHIKTDLKKIYTQFRVSNSHNGRDATESTSQSTNFVEAFAEIEGVNDLPWNFWVGKKFYRDQDVYIDDYYYFGSTNGNGGGVGNINLFGAKLSLAYLRQVTDTKTNIGNIGLTVYDARLKQLQLTDSLKQHFWIAYGHAPESSNKTTGVRYQKSKGFIVGTLLDLTLGSSGFNHTALMFGQGLMNGFNLYGDTQATGGSTQNSQKRLRFINHTTYNVNEKWIFHLSLNHERVIVHQDTREQWLGFGFRPSYLVTQNFHLVTEVGSSIVQNNGSKKLSRLTFAPQLSINENIWGRPVLRAFYTHSFWSENNKSNVAQNAPTYANKTAGGSYGVQMESFF